MNRSFIGINFKLIVDEMLLLKNQDSNSCRYRHISNIEDGIKSKFFSAPNKTRFRAKKENKACRLLFRETKSRKADLRTKSLIVADCHQDNSVKTESIMFPKHLQESAKWQQLNNQSSSFY
jgi:hypothetical protein